MHPPRHPVSVTRRYPDPSSQALHILPQHFSLLLSHISHHLPKKVHSSVFRHLFGSVVRLFSQPLQRHIFLPVSQLSYHCIYQSAQLVSGLLPMLCSRFINCFSPSSGPASLVGVVNSYGAFNSVLILRTPNLWLIGRLRMMAETSSSKGVKVKET